MANYLSLRIPAEGNLAAMTQREGLEEEKEDGEEEAGEPHRLQSASKARATSHIRPKEGKQHGRSSSPPFAQGARGGGAQDAPKEKPPP